MNDYLKEIAEICEINKHPTFHIARHTFATTVMLSNGAPIERVEDVGHTSIRNLRELDINDRQMEAVIYLKTAGKISNGKYQELFGVARNTASRDLSGLVEKGILASNGKGAGAFYILK